MTKMWGGMTKKMLRYDEVGVDESKDAFTTGFATVTPAQAGVHLTHDVLPWIPEKAGMTKMGVV